MINRHWRGFLIRLTGSVTLLALLLYLIDVDALAALIVRVDPYWLVATLALMIGQRFMMAIRWHYVMVHHDLPVGLGEAVRVTFVASTLGPLFPGGLGSDVLRGYLVAGKYGKATGVATTILLDRGIGIYSILLLATLGAAAIWWTGGGGVALLAGLAALQVLMLAGWGVAILWRGRIFRFEPRAGAAARLWRPVSALLRNLTDFAVLRRVAPAILALSLVVQLMRCLMFLCLFSAFGYDQALVHYVAYIPLVFLAGMLPVSIGGLGVREGALLLFFTDLGVPAEVCVGVGLLMHGLQLLLAALIAAVWLAATAAARLRPTSSAGL